MRRHTKPIFMSESRWVSRAFVLGKCQPDGLLFNTLTSQLQPILTTCSTRLSWYILNICPFSHQHGKCRDHCTSKIRHHDRSNLAGQQISLLPNYVENCSDESALGIIFGQIMSGWRSGIPTYNRGLCSKR